MASEQEVCVCAFVWIKGSMADSAEVQCHTGMFLRKGMGCWASLAEPLLPVTCQPALGTAHHRAAASCGSFPAFSVRLSHCVTPGWLLLYLVNLSQTISARVLASDSCPVLSGTNSFNYDLRVVASTLNIITFSPFSSISHVCQSEEAQCGFKGRASMSCFTLFTINPSVLPSVFSVQWRKSSGKGNIKQSEEYNAESTLLTQLGIKSIKWHTWQCFCCGIQKLVLDLLSLFYFKM